MSAKLKNKGLTPRMALTVMDMPLLLILLLSVILISCSKSPDKKQTNTHLFNAISQRDDITVRDLLKRGADANARDDNGCTALASASAIGSLSTATILVENGADLNTGCYAGYQVSSPLMLAASGGHTSTVKFLLEKGSDVNRRDDNGYSSLTYAINLGNTAIVLLLLEHGAEVNFNYKYVETPLVQAARKGNADIVRALLDKGADIRATDYNGYTALMQAVDKGFEEGNDGGSNLQIPIKEIWRIKRRETWRGN